MAELREYNYIVYDRKTKPVLFTENGGRCDWEWLKQQKAWIAETDIPIILGVDADGLVAWTGSPATCCATLGAPIAVYHQLIDAIEQNKGDDFLQDQIGEHNERVRLQIKHDEGLKELAVLAELLKSQPQLAERVSPMLDQCLSGVLQIEDKKNDPIEA